MSNLLKNYIKLLIESIEDSEIQIDPKEQNRIENENKYGEEINQKNYEFSINQISNSGWKDVNEALQYFKSLDQYYLPRETKIQYIKQYLDYKGLHLIGKGEFREVYSSPQSNYVIKLAFDLGSGTFSDDEFSSTEQEYNLYYSKDNQIFPKLYGYDNQDKLWIIFEKVHTFSENDNSKNYSILKKLLPLFFKKIETGLKIAQNCFNIQQSTNDMYIQLKIYEYAISIIKRYPHFYTSDTFIQKSSSSHSHLESKIFKNEMIDLIYQYKNNFKRDYTNNTAQKEEIKQCLSKANFDYGLTPDVNYILSKLEDSVTDLHEGNFGYRDITNTNKPWESFVVIDYGM